MKKRIFGLIAVLSTMGMLSACAVGAGAAPTPTPTPTPTLTPTPEAEASVADAETAPPEYEGIVFELTALDGETVSDALIRENRLTMVNFWATWCGPCVSEMPDLSQLNKDYADEGFGIIGVLSGDKDVEGAKAFLADNGISYPVVELGGAFLDYAANMQYIPTTIFFDADGKQVGDMVVGGKTYDDWAALIDALLALAP